MPTLLHLSDLHFGEPFLPEVADAALAHARKLDPEVVIVSGDLTQRAKASEFEQAREYLDRFDAPVVVTPGNHDVPLYRVWERFFAPYRNYRRYITDELNTVTQVAGMSVVSLNSSRRLTLSNGRIRQSQLDFATRAFEASDDPVRILVTHHHLAPPPDFEGGNVMPYAKRALRRFTELDVDLILAGHMHRSYIGSSLDFFPGEFARGGVVIVQCGTTTSRRGRGRERLRNTFNWIRVSGGAIRIAHHAWIGDISKFMPISEHVFPRGTKRYFEGVTEPWRTPERI